MLPECRGGAVPLSVFPEGAGKPTVLPRQAFQIELHLVFRPYCPLPGAALHSIRTPPPTGSKAPKQGYQKQESSGEGLAPERPWREGTLPRGDAEALRSEQSRLGDD